MYGRYLKSIIRYRHPRLSYKDNFTKEYTLKQVIYNVPIVYFIFGSWIMYNVTANTNAYYKRQTMILNNMKQ